MLKLKQIRTENNLTQSDVAELINVSRLTYAALENNKDRALTTSYVNLKLLSELFNLPIDELLQEVQ